MATATVLPVERALPPRLPIAAAYLVAIAAAEILIAVPGTDPNAGPYQEVGLSVHFLLLFTLVFHSVFIQENDAGLGTLLVALTLVPLLRIFSLSMPRYWGTGPTDTLPWLAAVSVPLLASVAAVAYVQGLRPGTLGITFGTRRQAAVQAAIGATGIPLGFVEYAILRPDPWIASAALAPILVGGLVIFLATGLSEELIFRGILLRRAVQVLGTRTGVLFVTLVFTALHVFFRNGYDLTFVFLVGLFYALAVVRTRSLWGAITSHTLGNVVLYLVAPFVLAAA